MDIVKTREQLKMLIDESSNEDMLNEVRSILELAAGGPYGLTDEQKNELEILEQKQEAGQMREYSWEEVKQELITKLKK
ncbi:MAG TPA: hypothetical protein VG603_07460 [Chitinophagales bacterium]|nr:hypothetical protein [Chitinophagales bacterium]